MKRVLLIRRGGAASGSYERYEADFDDTMTVLDALEFLRSGQVPDLAYRHSCHHGSCGTCTIRADGNEILACTTPLSALYRQDPDHIPVLEPLQCLDTKVDLAVDPGRLFRSLPEGLSRLRPSEVDEGETDQTRPAGIDFFVRFEDCIECGACVSACPVCVDTWTDDFKGAPFTGPLSLAYIRREVLKHPEKKEQLYPLLLKPEAVQACDRHLYCSKVCPRMVYPGKHIAMLRKEIKKID